MNPQGKKQIEVGDYAKNLRKIFDTLRKNNIEIIWATTTPVIDEWYTKQIGYPARRNEDVIAYNKAAAEIVREYSIPVDAFVFVRPTTIRTWRSYIATTASITIPRVAMRWGRASPHASGST